MLKGTRAVRHSLVILLSLMTSCTSVETQLSSGRFFVWVNGESVILSMTTEDPLSSCILSTASDRILETLRMIPEGTLTEITFSELDRPIFTSRLVIGGVYQDPRAEIRGQTIEPWCDSESVYWISRYRVLNSGDTVTD
jgi:hypothetical protein